MSSKAETSVGSKGEIYPPKKLREISKLNPGDKIEIEAAPGLMIIRKILSPAELLDLPPITSKSPEEIEGILEEIQKEL
jgi:bifunctional DNA-binding transcriptional regulator/antitoxin component of YhaV-PrlF toxin-antitoxin module